MAAPTSRSGAGPQGEGDLTNVLTALESLLRDGEPPHGASGQHAAGGGGAPSSTGQADGIASAGHLQQHSHQQLPPWARFGWAAAGAAPGGPDGEPAKWRGVEAWGDEALGLDPAASGKLRAEAMAFVPQPEPAGGQGQSDVPAQPQPQPHAPAAPDYRAAAAAAAGYWPAAPPMPMHVPGAAGFPYPVPMPMPMPVAHPEVLTVSPAERLVVETVASMVMGHRAKAGAVMAAAAAAAGAGAQLQDGGIAEVERDRERVEAELHILLRLALGPGAGSGNTGGGGGQGQAQWHATQQGASQARMQPGCGLQVLTDDEWSFLCWSAGQGHTAGILYRLLGPAAYAVAHAPDFARPMPMPLYLYEPCVVLALEMVKEDEKATAARDMEDRQAASAAVAAAQARAAATPAAPGAASAPAALNPMDAFRRAAAVQSMRLLFIKAELLLYDEDEGEDAGSGSKGEGGEGKDGKEVPDKDGSSRKLSKYKRLMSALHLFCGGPDASAPGVWAYAKRAVGLWAMRPSAPLLHSAQWADVEWAADKGYLAELVPPHALAQLQAVTLAPGAGSPADDAAPASEGRGQAAGLTATASAETALSPSAYAPAGRPGAATAGGAGAMPALPAGPGRAMPYPHPAEVEAWAAAARAAGHPVPYPYPMPPPPHAAAIPGMGSMGGVAMGPGGMGAYGPRPFMGLPPHAYPGPVAGAGPGAAMFGYPAAGAGGMAGPAAVQPGMGHLGPYAGHPAFAAGAAGVGGPGAMGMATGYPGMPSQAQAQGQGAGQGQAALSSTASGQAPSPMAMAGQGNAWAAYRGAGQMPAPGQPGPAGYPSVHPAYGQPGQGQGQGQAPYGRY